MLNCSSVNDLVVLEVLPCTPLAMARCGTKRFNAQLKATNETTLKPINDVALKPINETTLREFNRASHVHANRLHATHLHGR
jgi:hypothetical protein